MVNVAVVGPVFQEYVFAPEAVKVAAAPGQIVAEGETVNVGLGFTTMFTVFVSGQPGEFCPTTV
jgi:hypothetical protein